MMSIKEFKHYPFTTNHVPFSHVSNMIADIDSDINIRNVYLRTKCTHVMRESLKALPGFCRLPGSILRNGYA